VPALAYLRYRFEKDVLFVVPLVSYFHSFCFVTAVKIGHIHFYRYLPLVCPTIIVCLFQHIFIGWIIANIPVC